MRTHVHGFIILKAIVASCGSIVYLGARGTEERYMDRDQGSCCPMKEVTWNLYMSYSLRFLLSECTLRLQERVVWKKHGLHSEDPCT